MRILQKGLLSAVALIVVTCLLKAMPRVKNGFLPFSRIFKLGSPRRNLKAEVEAIFPRLVVPEKFVEYPRPYLGAIKSKLKEPFQKGARNLMPGRGKVFVSPSGIPGDPVHYRGLYLDWGAGRKFRIPRPRRGLGVVKINPLPPELTPVVALVNSKSGGKQGKNVLKRLRSALSKAQVFDIRKVDVKEALRLYSNLTNPVTVLVCGGDGTASRVFETVEDMEWKVPPRLSILPLGTGNDIARVLDWGGHSIDWSGGYFSEDPDDAMLSVLADIERALERRMDRWEIGITPGTAVPSLERHKQPVKYMLAYFGIGVDGKVALDFHRLRERFPSLFFSPLANKAIYGIMGLRDFIVRSCKNLPEKVDIWVDGRPLVLPPLTESFIILNINSHAGGVELWPDPDRVPERPRAWGAALSRPEGEEGGGMRKLRPSRFDDGLLEIVATTGVLHLGKIRVGLDRPVRLAQAREIRIRTKSFLPGQVDGEPWKLPRCELVIRHAGTAPVMQHLSKELVKYSDWLVEQGKLDRNSTDDLLKAFKKDAEPAPPSA